MYCEAIKVKPLSDGRIYVETKNGVVGICDVMEALI
jgi:hypothetical protein